MDLFSQKYHHALNPGQSWVVSAGFGTLIRFKPVKLGRGVKEVPDHLLVISLPPYVS